MRRRSLRRQQLILYRAVLFIGIIIAGVIIINGAVALASDNIKNGAKKIGVGLVQSIYLSISSKENHLFSYVASNETPKDTVFSLMAEGVAINHYALHQGKLAIDEDVEDESEDEYWMDLAEYTKEEAEDSIGKDSEDSDDDEDDTMFEEDDTTLVLDSELASLAETENQEVMVQDSSSDTLEIHYSIGGVEMLPEYKEALNAAKNGETLSKTAISVGNFIKSQYDMSKLLDYNYLLSNFYIVDSSTKATEAIFDVEKLLNMNMSIKKSNQGPQILIYHTHASETYIDSKPGVEADTVVGAGTYLTELLEGYGYKVYHDTTAYDRKENGESNRNFAYSTARPSIQQILKENPTIQVVIDLHRDSGPKRVTTINGKDTAQIMLFNGLSRNQSGPIKDLENPYQQENLSFSLQTALVGRKLYSGFVHKNYLKNYRYNMHLCERSLLIELGTANNTVMEAYNAMEPLASILNQVLSNP